jgi:hypothetical protein
LGLRDDPSATGLDDGGVLTAFDEAFKVEAPIGGAEKIRMFRTTQHVSEYIREFRKGGN